MGQESNFKIGDAVKIKDSEWEVSYNALAQFGFQRHVSYEVSGIYPNRGISLVGNTRIYYPHYFELSKVPEIKLTKPESTSALDKQVSGNHYKDCGIQPIEYIHANGLSYFQGNVVKYVTRYKDKAGKADLEKAIHYLELMIELEYSE